MFVALELSEKAENGRFWRLRRAFSRPRASLQESAVQGARYMCIRAPCFYGEPDWREIEELAGPMAGQMLFPQGVHPPENSALRPLQCPDFERKILLSTACELVARARIQMYRRVLGLVDVAADFTDMLPVLLRYYASLRVLTSQHEVYAEAAEQMMETLGAPVQPCEDSASFSDCVLVLAPGTLAGGTFPCPVLASDRAVQKTGCIAITELQAAVPRPVQEACPRGVDPHDFAAALHDHCNLELLDYTAKTMRLNLQTASIDQAAQWLAQRISAS